MDGIIAYILAKKLINGVVSGIANVTLKENQLVFEFNDGTSSTMTIPLPENGITPNIGNNGNWYIGDIDTGISAIGKEGKDGTFIIDMKINENNHLICILNDKSVIDAGELPIQQINLSLASKKDIDNIFNNELSFNLANKTDIDNLFS